MSIVVVGLGGQLACHLKELLPDARFLGRAEVDLTDLRRLREILVSAGASHIVNAAAYTAVDRAESEPDLAWTVNAEAPATMARVAEETGASLVHVSTDYVFDGHGTHAWNSDGALNPVN